MEQLLTHYTISEIILVIIILALAIKSLVDFIDWAKKRTRQAVEEADKPLELEEIAKEHEKELNAIKQELSSLKQSINLLIQSDRDNIKHSITKEHHYFCYRIGSIDDYSLDCLERKYSHYQEQGGNSFVQTLMQEIRALPKRAIE